MDGLKATDAAKVQAALGQGARANIEYADGMRPLAVAVARNDHAGAEALLRAGANPNIVVDIGAAGGTVGVASRRASLLSLAEDDAMARILVAGGADPNVKNDAGMTAVDLANANGQTQLVAVLTEGGGKATRDVAEARAQLRSTSGRDALRIFTTDLATDGRNIKIRGSVNNPHSESVHGVRYRVSLYVAGSNRVLDSSVEERDETEIQPGETVALRLDLASMYAASNFRFIVEAVPIRLGDRDVPEPPQWK